MALDVLNKIELQANNYYSDIFSFSFYFSQEVILKRAADLVEALYGLPHNNQVHTLTP